MSLKVLPNREHTFNISVKGMETGQLWEGNFTYRKPNLGAKSEIQKTKARLNGDLKYLDEDTLLLHEMWATFKHTIIECPEWFRKSAFGYDFDDVNVLTEVYKECVKFENDWQKKVWTPEDEVKKEEEPPKTSKEVLTKKK